MVRIFVVLALMLGLFVRASVAPARAAPDTVSITQTCSATSGRVDVTFLWNDVRRVVDQQWVDLSLFDNGWQPGTFLGWGPLPADATSVRWNGLIAGAVHFVRVNQHVMNDGWNPSQTFVFQTIRC